MPGPSKKKAINKDVSKSSGIKFFRDPVHDIIRVDKEFILKLINSRPMQRLRFIKQQGVGWFVYPGAEHIRFQHSLGVYHLSKRLMNQLRSSKYNITKADHDLIEATALLHDVGHGPFSHAFERALKEIKYKHFQSHEEWTKRIITDNQEITDLLSDRVRAEEIKELLSNVHKKQHLISIVSSQFDADRFDYMLRDSHMTGVDYGKFDLNWIFRNLSLDNAIAIDEDGRKTSKKVLRVVIDGKRGLSSLEDYLLGLFYMHQNVYLHRTVVAAEAMLISIIQCAVDLIGNNEDAHEWNPVLKKIANNKKLSTDEYLSLNDYVLYGWLIEWSRRKTPKRLGTLQRLASDFLSRRLFKALEFEPKPATMSEKEQKIRSALDKKNLNSKYFFRISDTARSAYLDWFDRHHANKLGQEVFVRDRNEEVKRFTELAGKSPISKAIMGLDLKKTYAIVHSEVEDLAKQILREE